MAEEGKDFSAGSMLLAFFLGGVVGASVALLVAPKAGEETRKMIKELADDAKKRAEDYLEQAKSKATSAVEKGKEFIEKEKSIIGSAIEAGKEAYGKEKEKEA
jgi:gas vesicle protein